MNANWRAVNTSAEQTDCYSRDTVRARARELGFVWDIYLDWGIQVMDFRGAIKNPGIKIENTLLA